MEEILGLFTDIPILTAEINLEFKEITEEIKRINKKNELFVSEVTVTQKKLEEKTERLTILSRQFSENRRIKSLS